MRTGIGPLADYSLTVVVYGSPITRSGFDIGNPLGQEQHAEVPEPASILLLSLGPAGFAALRRRNRG